MIDVSLVLAAMGVALVFPALAAAAKQSRHSSGLVRAIGGITLMFAAGMELSAGSLEIAPANAARSPLKQGVAYSLVGETLPIHGRVYALVQPLFEKDDAVVAVSFPGGGHPPFLFRVDAEQRIIPLDAN